MRNIETLRDGIESDKGRQARTSCRPFVECRPRTAWQSKLRRDLREGAMLRIKERPQNSTRPEKMQKRVQCSAWWSRDAITHRSASKQGRVKHCRENRMHSSAHAHVKNERALGRADARIAERRNADAIVVVWGWRSSERQAAGDKTPTGSVQHGTPRQHADSPKSRDCLRTQWRRVRPTWPLA